MSVAGRRFGRSRPQQEEDAAQLKLTDDFDNVQSLTVSEAKILIDAVMAKRQEAMNGAEVPVTDVMRKTLDYCSVFARFTTPESAQAAERLLKSIPQLRPFERGQLGTLCCEDAEEAKTLIPSLADRVDDTRLQQLLDELSSLRKFQ